ncbi:hypothetical protein [uncultured Helicobacter sp.]|uniref:hypothetical protein n=1 Tax=uncultured Helicobacter sp. TaxID=175537 RepID=UPI003752E8B1
MPVGKANKVCFNAHRVYLPQTIIDTLDEMDIIEMSYISGFDTIVCMERVGGVLKTHQQALDAIPDMRSNGTTGLFEFVKR